MRKLIPVFFIAFVSPSAAEDYAAIVDEAFANIDADYRDQWAYSETTSEEGRTLVGHYDPRRPVGERWTLKSVDGRAPTSDELDEYLEDKADDQGDERDDGGDDDAQDFVNVDSLALLEETSGYWLFGFTPNLEDEDDDARKFMQQVNGTLKVAKDGPYVESLELSNDKPIKPAFSVRISHFLTRLTFGPAAEGGPIVPLTMDVRIKGRAAVVIRFDEAESIAYSDYEFAGG